MLEEYISVFRRAAKYGVFGVYCACTELCDRVHIDHFGKILIIPCFDFLDLVRGTEAVEEVDERYTTLNGGKVSNRAEVHDFLRVGFRKHCETGLTAGIHVGMVAENVKRVRSNATRRNMDNAGKQFACDLVHIRDHEQKALRSRVCSGKSTCGKASVNGACCTCFRLHFGHLDSFTENVSCRFAEDVFIIGGPCVGHFSHRAGRSDRVDSGNFRKRVADVRGGGVTVHGDFLSCHVLISS